MVGVSAQPDPLAGRLEHVRWVGGGSGAGKSTVARRLAEEHDLRVYRSDETIQAHVGRSNPVDHPLLHAFLAMDMDERWLNRSPQVMLESFHAFEGEAFELIVDDLLALPMDTPVLAEGFRLLPRLVAPLLGRLDQAVWLVPSPQFRRAAFAARGFTWEIPGKTSEPERALQNLLERDRLFTDQVAAESAGLGLAVIEVDVGLSVETLTELVGDALGLKLRPSRAGCNV
ncbi:MAG: AAA family ATPase [Candidatus Limnocylindria bacterium]